jgi:hypothetical protein
MVTISARSIYKHIQNMQTSQGYIFRILQYFVTKFCNLTNFNKFFTGILTCKLSIAERFVDGNFVCKFCTFIRPNQEQLQISGRNQWHFRLGF